MSKKVFIGIPYDELSAIDIQKELAWAEAYVRVLFGDVSIQFIIEKISRVEDCDELIFYDGISRLADCDFIYLPKNWRNFSECKRFSKYASFKKINIIC